jgi:DnaK suppressor protein
MLKKKFINDIKKKLLSEKSVLLKKSEPATDIDLDGDETDIIQGNIILDMHMHFVDLTNQKLSSIESALKRINENTYGICADCGEDIPEKRLLANLYSLICISCAEEREISLKHRKRS